MAHYVAASVARRAAARRQLPAPIRSHPASYTTGDGPYRLWAALSSCARAVLRRPSPGLVDTPGCRVAGFSSAASETKPHETACQPSHILPLPPSGKR